MADVVAPEQTTAPTLSGQVSRAMFWNAVLQPARLLAGLVSGLVVGNVLTGDAYGAVALLGAMATTLGLVVDLGVERSLVKFLPEIEARYGRDGVRRTLWLVVAQKLAILVILVALALLFRSSFFAFWRGRVSEPATLALLDTRRWLFFWGLMALVIFGALFDVYMQALVSYFRQRAWNAIVLLVTILKPLLLAGVVLLGWGVTGIVAVSVAIPIAATILAAWQAAAIRPTLAPRPTRPSAGSRLVQRFFGYSALSYWIQLTEYAYSLEFVLLALPGATAAAGFKIAYGLVNQILTGLWSPLVGVQIPLFARLHVRGDDRQLGDAYAALSKFLATLMLPAAAGLALLAPNLLALLWPKYAGFAPVAQILTVAFCIDAAISVPLAILMAYERFRPMLLARTGALVAVPLLLAVAPRYGATGAAIVMGGTRLATDGLAMALALRLLPLRYPLRFTLRVAVASMVMGLGVAPFAWWLLTPPANLAVPARVTYLAGNLLLGLAGAAVYLLVFRLSGGLDVEDRRRIAALRLPGAARLLRFLA